MICTNKRGNRFAKELVANIPGSSEITIAVGYVGQAAVNRYTKLLVKAARRGPVRVLLGMWQRTSAMGNATYTALEDLNKKLKATNSSSGVFLTRNQYHGKIYRFATSAKSTIWLGSSNFSDNGLAGQLEAMTELTDPGDIQEIQQYLSDLLNKSTRIDLVLRPPAPAVSLKDVVPMTSLPSSLTKDPGSLKLPLQVDLQPKSGINLCMGKGRLNKKTGTYQPRPWYEVEISSPANVRQDPLYPRTPNCKPQRSNGKQQLNVRCEFRVFFYDGSKYWECKASTYSADNKAMGTDPRTLLGEFIKGRLEAAGVLRKDETVTSDTLDLYGRDYVELTRYTDTSKLSPTGQPAADLSDKAYVLFF